MADILSRPHCVKEGQMQGNVQGSETVTFRYIIFHCEDYMRLGSKDVKPLSRFKVIWKCHISNLVPSRLHDKTSDHLSDKCTMTTTPSNQKWRANNQQFRTFSPWKKSLTLPSNILMEIAPQDAYNFTKTIAIYTNRLSYLPAEIR